MLDINDSTVMNFILDKIEMFQFLLDWLCCVMQQLISTVTIPPGTRSERAKLYHRDNQFVQKLSSEIKWKVQNPTPWSTKLHMISFINVSELMTKENFYGFNKLRGVFQLDTSSQDCLDPAKSR